jgi:hypothetical protein
MHVSTEAQQKERAVVHSLSSIAAVAKEMQQAALTVRMSQRCVISTDFYYDLAYQPVVGVVADRSSW